MCSILFFFWSFVLYISSRYLCYISSIDLKNVLCFGPYMGKFNCIVFSIFFLSWIYLPCTRSVEHISVDLIKRLEGVLL